MDRLPEPFKKKVTQISQELLPAKSKLKYEESYKNFCKWLNEQCIKPSEVSDDVVLVYLSELSKLVKPNTLWSKYSMIKSCFKINENIDFSSFAKSIAYLKRQSVGYTPKKSKVFRADEITNFMIDAPDNEWLLSKAILCFGLFGACRKDELLNLTIDNVIDNGSFLTVFIKNDKTHSNRSFTITDEECSFRPCNIIRRYMSLRPEHMTSKRFFATYRQGKCVNLHVGANTIAAVPKKVATYLGLENPESYTGHSLRRSSATMLVEGGGDLLTLKRHGGWKSSAVAEGYIEESVTRKIDVSKKLFKTATTHTATKAQPTPTTSSSTSTSFLDQNSHDKFFTIDDIFAESEEETEFGNLMIQNTISHNEETLQILNKIPNKGINISNNTNCTINIHLGGKQ